MEDIRGCLNDGHVLFKIKTRDDLEEGQVLRNSAAIYFDFNLPIITNMTVTEIEDDIDNDGVDYTWIVTEKYWLPYRN